MEQTINKLLAAQQTLAEARKEVDPLYLEAADIARAMGMITQAITKIETRVNHAEQLRDIYHRLNEIRLNLPVDHHAERGDIVKAMSNITIAITMIEARAKAGVGAA